MIMNDNECSDKCKLQAVYLGEEMAKVQVRSQMRPRFKRQEDKGNKGLIKRLIKRLILWFSCEAHSLPNLNRSRSGSSESGYPKA